MKNFVQRSLTGFLFAIVTLISILWHEVTFTLFYGIVMLLILIEYHHMLRKVHGHPLMAWQIILSILMYVGGWLVVNKVIPFSALALTIPLFFLVFITELYRRKRRIAQNLSMTFLPVIHVALPLALLVAIGYLSGEYDDRMILSIVLFTWTFDTFAYIVGVLIGKNRIAPKISPKKSWEGFIGGLVASAGLALVLSHYWAVFDPVKWIVISVLISIGATFGDLVESVLKRAAGMKDSGRILPGHGGVFDRFDGFLFAIPFVFSYLYLLN
ncbi:phosphatidate cytidylyltransferase [Salinivirga cyanobacteriivorans]